LARKVASDLRDIIKARSTPFAELLRGLATASDRAVRVSYGK
jgi:hypothetical protein